ncbi:MAG: sigma factor-like helix-turn-helix DNA-binding protein [Planctomycetota bacterium]|jgi:DNA-directed RNA polymerase specialized sigma24 family protein
MSNKRARLYNSIHDEAQSLQARRDEMAEILLGRSTRMDSKQKALLRMILDRGASYGQVARLSGEHASTVSRRFRAMVRRLRNGPPHTAEALGTLTPLEKTILIESFVYGATQKKIAAKMGISRYRVRKTLAPFRTRMHECKNTTTQE